MQCHPILWIKVGEHTKMQEESGLPLIQSHLATHRTIGPKWMIFLQTND